MRNHPVLVLVAVLLSTLALPVSLTGAAVALTEIGRDLDAGLAGVQWVVNGYNATFASFMLAAGALADLFGRRRVFAIGLAIFAGAGLLAVAADDLLLFNVLRALAGVGAAAAATSAGAILAGTFHGAARTRAFSAFGTTIGAGLAFGPSIAGLLIEAFGWRAVFAVPSLVALLVLTVVPLLPESRPPRAGRVDWPGTVSFTAALLLLIFGFVQGPEFGWSDPRIVAAFIAVPVLLLFFVGVQRRRTDPMFDLSLLANPQFVGICLAAAVIVAVLVPLLVYLPSYLTTVVGLAPSTAGVTLLLLTAPTVLLPFLGGALSRAVPPAVVIVVSVAVVAAGAAWATVIGPSSGAAALAGPLLSIGVGVGLSIGLLDALAIGSVAPHRAATGAGMINTSRLASETIAIAVVGAVLASATAGRLADPGFTAGLRTVLWSMAAISAGAAVVSAVLLRRGYRGQS
ncbi:MFS transporter [Micromonospora endophytica]|uniref:MFS transporter n=1 Tax=Micromonospora endophytica TaxID=515350 RepID=A0A2W2CFE9_9ACTN|nr:MFS transporter [Micromonospora endophytica]PZF90488.1 MFS transporter [Micromonospora endophytica]RIW50939.1 MFS transporter [Micromonospora endophytica]BCJ58358.1 membrane protein [Micromonospora endophytica]